MNFFLGQYRLWQQPAAVSQLRPLCTTPASSHWSPGYLWPHTKLFCPPAAGRFCPLWAAEGWRKLHRGSKPLKSWRMLYRLKQHLFCPRVITEHLVRTYLVYGVGWSLLLVRYSITICVIYDCKPIPVRSFRNDIWTAKGCENLEQNSATSDEAGQCVREGR